MLETIFANPGYLVAGGALVSSPVIIHLINRMRFRRIRWGAMEFLLKAQKRSRRRLIIEQLILLLLRILLVLLTVLLVLRFIGFSFAGFVRQDGIHVVVLDDSLSTNARWQDKDGKEQNCFRLAKEQVIMKRIYNSVARSTTNERLVIIPLSRLKDDPDYQPTVFEKIGLEDSRKAIQTELAGMKPTKLELDISTGVAKAAEIFEQHPKKRHILHVVSDFREVDWGRGSEGLYSKLRTLVEQDAKVILTDTAYPLRTEGQGALQLTRDNIGIVDFRAMTKVVAAGKRAKFKVTVRNFSNKNEAVNIIIYDGDTGDEQNLIGQEWNVEMPLKVPANSTASAMFDYEIPPEVKIKGFSALKLVAQLETGQRQAMEDALIIDNQRQAYVEIRDKEPVLIIDGKGQQGLQPEKDGFHIETVFISVRDNDKFQLVWGHDYNSSNPAKALEMPNLSKFPTIFLMNVPSFSDKQRKNLEQYVREGGGVVFFLGEQVIGSHYTTKLYREGKGVFPAPIEDTYYPSKTAKPKGLQFQFTGTYQLILRDDQFEGVEDMPIFGKVFPTEEQKFFLYFLPINRYFKVNRAKWKKEQANNVTELATLPNTASAQNYIGVVRQRITNVLEEKFEKDPRFSKYHAAFKRHREAILKTVEPGRTDLLTGKPFQAYHLADVLKTFLTDAGIATRKETHPNLRKFWDLDVLKTFPEEQRLEVGNSIKKLRKEIETMYASTQYGDPFVITQRYGKGRVVAVMSTAGKEWNKWGGGSKAEDTYLPFIYNLQRYLATQAGSADQFVGSVVTKDRDLKPLKKKGINALKVVQTRYICEPKKKAQVKTDPPKKGTISKDRIQSFEFTRTYEPGFYLYKMFNHDAQENDVPIETWAKVFNVNTEREGNLQRITQDQFARYLKADSADAGAPADKSAIQIQNADAPLDELINKETDLSESAWIFLFFLLLLISEQAMAVHLSHHLRSSESAQAAPGTTAAPVHSQAA